jgi:hypothetical protein
MTALNKTMRGKELVIVRGRDFFDLTVDMRHSYNFLNATRQEESHHVHELIHS